MKTEGPTQHPLTFQHPALLALPKKERRRITKRCLNIVMKQYGLWRWITIILVLNLATQFALRILLAPMPLNRDWLG